MARRKELSEDLRKRVADAQQAKKQSKNLSRPWKPPIHKQTERGILRSLQE